MLNFDTIAAIATPIGEGAIGIVRLSGPRAIEIANQLFQEKDLTKAKSHMLYYGHIYAPKTRTLIDEVMLVVMRAPKTFTREDVVEIQCHGGIRSVQRVLDTVLETGARLAEPGEFTKRAFLNGRIDLSQAEGVIDVIRAKTDLAADVALGQLEGKLSKKVRELRQQILETLAHIEVNIDYPEYDDVHQLTEDEILPKAKTWLKDIQKLIDEAKKAVNIREGIDTVILGRPNVGKSSLLNALLEEDKAIVTDIAGTTRDIVEGTVRLDGITLNLIDTAGIHESNDIVEKIGIDKSLQALEKAELVIVVIDGSEALTDEDHKLLEMTKNKNRIVVYNKNDKAIQHDGISISAINGDVEALTNAIKEKYEKELYLASSDTLNNERQIGLAIQAEQSMKNAIRTLEDGMELDLVTIDLENAWTSLKEITGKAGKEDLLDEIFSRFCLGK